MSVTDPVVVHLKYEIDWALASLVSLYVPIAVFPKEDEVGLAVAVGVGVGEGVDVGTGVGVGVVVGVGVGVGLSETLP
jgi:hypothetical protein